MWAPWTWGTQGMSTDIFNRRPLSTYLCQPLLTAAECLHPLCNIITPILQKRKWRHREVK